MRQSVSPLKFVDFVEFTQPFQKSHNLFLCYPSLKAVSFKEFEAGVYFSTVGEHIVGRAKKTNFGDIETHKLHKVPKSTLIL